jgi:hypothetical protein
MPLKMKIKLRIPRIPSLPPPLSNAFVLLVFVIISISYDFALPGFRLGIVFVPFPYRKRKEMR